MAGSISYNTGRLGGASYVKIKRYNASTGAYTDIPPGTAFDYFDDSPNVNDAIYFGYDRGGYELLAGVELDPVTALVGTDVVLKWEYWARYAGNVWREIPNLNDATNGLTVTGSNLMVYFPYPPFKYETTIDGLKAAWIRCRIESFGSISEGGANDAVVPEFGNGEIMINDYPQEAPATLEDIYQYMKANHPEVGMEKLGVGVGYSGKAYMLPHASIYGGNGYWKMDRNFLQIGNASHGNNGRIIGFHYCTDGQKIGTDKFSDGSTIASCFRVGSSHYSFGTESRLYGTTFQKGTYAQEIDGTLYEAEGSGYVYFGSGEYLGVRVFGYGTNLNGQTMKNCFFYSGGNVTSPFGDKTLENIHLYRTTSDVIWLYTGSGTGECVGLNWYVPAGGKLFRAQSLGTAAGPYIWNFLNPSPAFPELDDDPAYIATAGTEVQKTSWHIYERYTLDMMVQSKDGSPISGVVVVCVDDLDGSEAFSITTDENGQIVQQKMLRSHGYYDGGVVKENHYSYTLTISAPGYQTKTMVLSMDRKREEVVTLERIVPAIHTADTNRLIVNAHPSKSDNSDEWVEVE